MNFRLGFLLLAVSALATPVSARDADPIVEAAILRLEARGAIVKPFRVAEIDLRGNVVRLGDENDGRLITANGQIEPAVLADLKVIPRLLLEIRGPGFSQCDDLVDLKNLVGLDIAGTKVEDSGLVTIGKLRSLRMLDLSFNRLSGRCLTHLQTLDRLQFLSLIETHVDDTAVQPLCRLASMRSLQMKGTQLSPLGREAVAAALKECSISWPAMESR